MITVDGIHSSPVKSLSLLGHHSTHVGFNGIEGDREFYLVNSDGRLVTQREFGKLVLVRATYSADHDSLKMVFPDGLIVESPLVQGRKIVTRIWGRRVTALYFMEIGRKLSPIFVVLLSLWYSRKYKVNVLTNILCRCYPILRFKP